MLLVSLGAAKVARSAALPNDGFDPNANGTVNAIQLQPDGKILIGGYFTQLHPYGNAATGCGHIARLNHDGTVDGSFSPSANGVVLGIVLQPNGQIIISGQFTAIQPTGGGSAVARNYVARLNADGTLDTAFNPNANGVVYAVACQPNGQILIGGSFTTVQPNGAAAPVTRNHIARFNTDSSLDTSFDPNANRPVLALAVEPNGQILVGGGFSTFQPNGATSSATRNCAARLNADGSLDTGFDPEPNGSVDTILVLPSGQIIFGGEFVTLQPNGAANAIQCDFLARLNADGTLDTNYIVNPLATVSAVAIQPDGKLLVGGTFTQVYPPSSVSATPASYVVRINPDGAVDGGFVPGINQAVNAIALQPDGEIILGGYFTSILAQDSATPVARNYIARLTKYGIPDASLSPDEAGTVYVSAALPNGQMLVGGSFLSIGGVSQSFLARLNANGSLDTLFAPTLNGPVQAIAMQSNGQAIIGGQFTQVDGFVRNYIARINTDGTIDGPFNPTANSSVTAIALLSSGQILIGGGFTALTPNGSTDSYSVNYFARLNADGSLDFTFHPSPSGSVYAIAVLGDGRILVSGSFTSIAGAARGYVARLLSTGAIDTAPFDPEPNGSVFALAVQTDGKVLIGGLFTGVLPQTGKTGTPTTTTDAGGNTVTVPATGTNATTPIAINHLARLNTDGTLDFSFFPDPSAAVLGLAIQSDGNIVVGGAQTSFARNGSTTGVIRNYIGRVGTDGSLDSGFNPNANALVSVASVLSNGHILVGGSFTTLQPNGASTPTYANHLALLNPDGTVDPTFTSGGATTPNGQVNALAQMPNGQFIVGGSFGPLGGNRASFLARFNPDGSPDTVYNPGIDGPVNSVAVLPSGAATLTSTNSGVWLEANGAVRHTFTAATSGEVVAVAQQADGKVIIGGLFDDYAGSSNVSNLVRLNPDGTLDTTFNATTNGIVNTIVIQPDKKILIGGNFTQVYSTANAYLARLNADGTLDTTFAPQPNVQVLSLAVLSNGKILVGGDFSFMAYGTTTAAPINYFARLNSDGTLDKTFVPDPNGPIYQIAPLSSGQILISGAFTTITPNLSTTYYVQYLARINSDGTLDKTFYPDPNYPITAMVLQPNGQIVVGGSFSGFQQNPNITGITSGSAGYITPAAIVTRNNAARVKPDGTIDTSFDPHPDGGLTSIALQANGQIYLGGSFSSLQPNEVGNPVTRSNVARINSDGTLDPSFDPEVYGPVNVVAPLADGSVIVGGNFSTVQSGGAYLVGGNFAHVGGNPATNLALLNSDGTFDGSYGAHPDGPVNAIASQQNGQTLIGGAFSNVDGLPSANLARTNADGSLDTSFNAATNAPVNAILVQQNGQILAGGAFTKIADQNVTYIARLGSSGSPDALFAPSVNGTVYSVVLQPNGQIVISGAFTSVAGQPIGGIARLNADGSLDASFNPNANGTVQALTLQTDGTFFAGGAFTSIGGQPIANVAHILSNGAIDTSFNPSPNGTVSAISVQSDGKVVIGGSFTTAGGLSRYEFARFAASTPVTQTVSVSADQSTIAWTLSGGAPELSTVTFAESTDGTHWSNVGQATTADGSTWRLTGLVPPGASPFFVRATGISLCSQYSSAGLVQATYLEYSGATPAINSPSSVTAISGTPFLFTVTGTASPTTFSASGLPPGLSMSSTTGLISGTPTATGTYNVTVTVANAAGSTVSTLAITVSSSGGGQPPPSNSADRLFNLSCRADLSGNQVLIAGFVISGTGSKTVLIRAVGPGLAAFNVSGVMATPELQLISSSGAVLGQNSVWGGSSSLSAVFEQVGAFALASSSTDAALVATLLPGSYTVHVFDPTAAGGVVLAEIYDASAAPLTAPQRLINISARGTVSQGAGALIGGFVVSGSSNKSVLIRGVGPGLAAFGVTDSIPDPVLNVYNANDSVVAQNSAWTTQTVASPYQPTISASDITSADSSVGAFALSPQSADTALIVNLPPGSYTFQITSVSNATGEALGEVYELP